MQLRACRQCLRSDRVYVVGPQIEGGEALEVLAFC